MARTGRLAVMTAFPTYVVLDKQKRECIHYRIDHAHITLQAGSSALPPLDVVVMAAVFAISSITSLHNCAEESQLDLIKFEMEENVTSPVIALHSQ
jgi:hypothetical protein